MQFTWNEFYSTVPEAESLSAKKNEEVRRTSSYYITNCYFGHFTSTSIIFTSTSSDTRVLTEETVFTNNTNDGNSDGGSFLFSSEGQCVQNRICSFQSCLPIKSESYKGIYCCVNVSSSTDAKNFIIDSSVAESGKSKKEGNKNVILINGQQSIETLNISKSSVYYRSLYELNNIATDSNVSFCSFVNNTAISNWACSHSGDKARVVYIKFCNFQQNKGSSRLIGTYGPSLSISNCSILQNKFETFSRSGDINYILVDQCFLDRSDGENVEGKTTIQNTIKDETVFLFPQLSTAQCEAAIPIVYVDNRIKIRHISINQCKIVDVLSAINKLGTSFWFIS